ncbi:MAG: hypothetical protein PHR84_05695 [Candidatus Omnitrophica bacterium]|jgi:hypothetical protein|nr:hypothetical protein [Candidatus Omnitrophota bacterium]MDD5661129.1 hypothetical protein [Candidatus Omnitrophota bacterium]
MARNVVLSIGETIKYPVDRTGIIEKIKVISTGSYVNKFEYKGNDEDIVLTLKNDHGITNLWLKDASISKIN